MQRKLVKHGLPLDADHAQVTAKLKQVMDEEEAVGKKLAQSYNILMLAAETKSKLLINQLSVIKSLARVFDTQATQLINLAVTP